MTDETVAGDRQGECGFAPRHVFIWAAIILFSNSLVEVIKKATTHSAVQVVGDILAVGIFQYMAWYAIFYLIVTSNPLPKARLRDFGITTAFCLMVFLPTNRMVWIAATGLAVYLWVFYGNDRNLRAAGTVLAALSMQQFWGRVFFDFIGSALMRAETAVVGTLLSASQPGTVWQENVITGPSGHGIVIFPFCSSFHNVSLALLCWVTLVQLRNQNWRRRTFIFGGIVAGTMVLLNFARLYSMALDIDSYRFWHDGLGAEIFEVGASVSILLLSLFGVRPVDRRA